MSRQTLESVKGAGETAALFAKEVRDKKQQNVNWNIHIPNSAKFDDIESELVRTVKGILEPLGYEIKHHREPNNSMTISVIK